LEEKTYREYLSKRGLKGMAVENAVAAVGEFEHFLEAENKTSSRHRSTTSRCTSRGSSLPGATPRSVSSP